MVLYDWSVSTFNEITRLHGIVFGHPKLADGMSITTSRAEHIEIDNAAKVIRVVTHSRSHYDLHFEKIDFQNEVLGQTIASLKLWNIPCGFVDEAKVIAKQIAESKLKEADELLSDGDLLLEAAGNNISDAYFKFEGKVYKLDIYTHVGMFQDSVLIRHRGVVDFRYFPYVDSMETYHISDNIKGLYFRNISDSAVVLDHISYPSHGMTYTSLTGYKYQEGLFSPDCFNGKSLFTTNNQDGGEE